ncbi:MAG TPA: hypothetical protein VFD14_02515 [Clostridia bacterium]|nr:hypothetical protein [Clostridia bacterium]
MSAPPFSFIECRLCLTLTSFLYFILGMLGLALLFTLLAAIIRPFFLAKLEGEIRKHGLKEVIVREVNSRIHDDTLANTLMGHEIAGMTGAVLGALSGSQWEHVKSIRFWIKLGNGEKKDITLKPRDALCKRLLAFMDSQDFQAW